MSISSRTIRAPRGTALSCKGWPQEAALRMLMNNLDPDIAERPDHLMVDTRVTPWRQSGRARSIGLEANASEVLPELVRRDILPDVLTDEASANDAVDGYVPGG